MYIFYRLNMKLKIYDIHKYIIHSPDFYNTEMSQLLEYFTDSDQDNDTLYLLDERSDDTIALSSPYTVYMKANGTRNYLFIAYSLGSNRNVVAGTMNTEEGKKVNV